ncbi:MAG: DUF1501 domain-containing protein [Verrucomicrobiales bacterium]
MNQTSFRKPSIQEVSLEMLMAAPERIDISAEPQHLRKMDGIIEKSVHIEDFNAAILRCLGQDHERLTHRFQDRDFRLTDLHRHLVHVILT